MFEIMASSNFNYYTNCLSAQIIFVLVNCDFQTKCPISFEHCGLTQVCRIYDYNDNVNNNQPTAYNMLHKYH